MDRSERLLSYLDRPLGEIADDAYRVSLDIPMRALRAYLRVAEGIGEGIEALYDNLL